MPEPEESVDERLARLERELAELRAARDVRSDPQVFGVSGQASFDLDSAIGSDKAAQVHAILQQFGMDGAFGSPSRSPAPVASRYLSEPPRSVPIAFHLAGLSWKWWEAFAILMTFAAPIALWILLPETLPVPFLGLLAVIAVYRIHALGNRSHVLKWGKVATVTAVNVASVGTYFSGVTYNNVRLAQARGWDVERRWYSGPGHTTDVEYTVDGTPGALRIRGLPYASGIILASVKKPSKALCVSDFPYDLEVDANGNWVGSVPTSVWFGACATVLVYLGLVLGAVWAVSTTWIG